MENAVKGKKETDEKPEKLKWYERLSHPLALIFYVLLFVYVLTLILPAGEFSRELVDGRTRVIPGTFHHISASWLSPLDMMFSIPEGMESAASIIFVTFIAGGVFRLLSATGALENMVGTLVNRLGGNRQHLAIWVLTFVFGFLGMVMGYESNIALVPLAVLVGLALGGDLIVGLSIAIGGVGFGFATSPINPYTVAVSQKIAELPLFSGYVLRSMLLIIMLSTVAHHTCRYLKKVKQNPECSLAKGLSTEGLQLSRDIASYRMHGVDISILLVFAAGFSLMVFGIFEKGWYINEIAGVFLCIAVVSGLLARMKTETMVRHLIQGAASVTGGALIIGVARAIQVLLEKGQIGDTLINALASPLSDLPVLISTLGMTVVHSIINIFIPSGSGQAMATMPIIIPLSDLIGMTRQTAILAFQVGDGFTNMITPTSGGTLAMLALIGVPYDRWVRYFFPLFLKCFLISWVVLGVAVMIHY